MSVLMEVCKGGGEGVCYGGPVGLGRAVADAHDVSADDVQVTTGASEALSMVGLNDDETTMVIVNSPHNPTGACVTEDELSALHGAVRQVRAILAGSLAIRQNTTGAGVSRTSSVPSPS